MLKWTTTKEEILTIGAICDRAIKGLYASTTSKMDLVMDIEAAHCNGCQLDLVKFLNFDDFDFYHDIRGIRNHLDRITGKLRNCFLPRCSR